MLTGKYKRGVIIPIIGGRKLSQIQDNLAAVDIRLSDEQPARLDEVNAIQLGFQALWRGQIDLGKT